MPSKTAVNLGESHVRSVLVPVRTLLLKLSRIRQRNLVLGFKELNTETLRDVPGNVAMHEPSTGVVGREGQNEPARSGQSGCVSARRIVEVELASHGRRIKV